jgi:CheY-like chemotaxis protein
MGKKILLADDSITIQKVIELTFSDEDFDVVTVGNGRLAIEKVLDVRPDVVLCDIIMPEKDGYEVCDFVKKNPALSHVPVLLLTGAFEPFDQERATRVGCDGFLAKPFEPQALIAKVKDLLRQAEARQPAAAAAPPPARAAEPEPQPQRSPEATVWAAPSPVAGNAPWEAPQTRPVWTPPPPPAEASGVQFIPEDPFGEEPSPSYQAPSGETVRVPSFREEQFDGTPEVEPEPYVIDTPGAGPEELLPMTGEEEESLAEPIPWEEPRPVEPPPQAMTVTAERDLFLEEVFDEPAAATLAAPAAEPERAPEAPPEPEPESTPEPARAASSVLDFAAVAREAGVESRSFVEPRPEPELEPEPEIEEPEIEEEPVAAAPGPAPAPAPEAAPEPEPPALVTPEPETPPAAAAEQAPATVAELQFEDESFAEVAPPLEAAPEPPPSEAGAVAVPMDMVSQIAQRVVAQISEKVIREIAWEVIPDMAEALIKREIERLTAELHRS